jgi:predicted Rossmann fold flavoprotein
MSAAGGREIVVVGAGAAGFFGAVRCAEAAPDATVHLLEATAHPLAKVRVSGGGRCNVTHACFDPRELVRRYPRGSRELIGAFHRFGPRETIAWFAQRGVELKTEADGRMFPVTDSSATIVDALTTAAARAGVRLRTQTPVREIVRGEDGRFRVSCGTGDVLTADRVLLATGGNQGAGGIAIARAFGHAIEPQVPSLFAFNVSDPRLRGLEGVAVQDASVAMPDARLVERGPVLVTHRGLSGPAVLRLSAWGARACQESGYAFGIVVNWSPGLRPEQIAGALSREREAHGRRQVATANPFGLPGRLWEVLVTAAGVPAGCVWAQTSKAMLGALAAQIGESRFAVEGKSTNKEEFVTCGGVRLREVDFKTMESRLCPGLHFAGEVLDIDGITGGFNFQAAWATGWLAGTAMAGVT